MKDQYRDAFKEEAYELLTELESSLLELEETPDDMDIIGRVFRAMHTIKGSGAMFGFDDIAAFTHEVETVFDMVRNGLVNVSPELIRYTLAARDQIKALLDASSGGSGADSAEGDRIIAALRMLLPSKTGEALEPAAIAESAGPETPPAGPVESITYRIRFKPATGIFFSGANPVALLNELRGLGACKVVAQRGNLPPLSEMEAELSYIYWDIILTTAEGIDAIKDVFIFVEDDCELKIDIIDDGGRLDNEADYKKLGDILVERGDLCPEEMTRVLSEQKRFGELLVEKGLVATDKVQSALIEQQHVRDIRQERQSQETVASIRVPADKLDILVNLVGELVTVQARLSQMAAIRSEAELTSVAEEVERLTSELRDNALGIRMLPIGTTFSKFKRLVHDLSRELGKEIEMTTDGAETELDKNILEKLNDPLVHLIRNCIDHGIEMPEARTAAGKSGKGTVHLGAVHSGDSVLISITDDGAGLDREAIRAKAVEKGLLSAGVELSDREIFAQIFAPGFSTAKQVTSVSGRGVGMDVVKRAIDALRGTIDLKSQVGKGTTVTIKIPLTLAIIESLLVKIGDDCFVMPLSIVDECVELTRKDVENSHGRNLANVRGGMIPYIQLRERFKIEGEPPLIEQIVITRINNAQVGFVVDHVIGEHQTVIKSLGRAYRNTQGLSGATILGNGSVALILDLPQIFDAAEKDELYEPPAKRFLIYGNAPSMGHH
jgi:two-component system chemotaxis sensor kinase CheA